MLASLEEAPLQSEAFVYEPKYDGIRTLVELEAGGGPGAVRLWSRLGNQKTSQFPEIARALERLARRLKAGALLDGEIVALDEAGEPAGFQRLQGRIHLTGLREIGGRALTQPVAFIAFDALRDGDEDLRALPLTARRARLERILGNAGSTVVRLSEFVPGDGRALYRRALEHGWEGLIAKRLDSRYQSGRRTSDWRKVKLVRRQECVIGGWTDPRGTRGHFGALLLGVRESDALRYVGHTGTGFDRRELARVAALLEARATDVCHFETRPRTNERPHWVRPELVAEIAFTEWTADGKLRHPVYLGLREDIDARAVRRNPELSSTREVVASPARAAARLAPRRPEPSQMPYADAPGALGRLVTRLAGIEAAGGDGTIDLPNGDRLAVGNLDKVFWPGLGITKGELMRYYTWVSRFILPAVADRPLIMRRFPNGIRGRGFYQQRAPEEVPPGVPTAKLPSDTEVPTRLIGGSLTTLLHMTQIAAISQDPWFSRVQSPDDADHVALDLDPMPGVPFATVLDVARFIHDELQALGTPGVPKTSGSEGVHIYIPLPPSTPYEAGRLFCEIIATLVADRHPKVATVERAVDARGRRVYIDYLQNIRGKSLATAYSARATEFAGVSAPLTWREIHAGVDRRDFTLRTLPARIRAAGDLWAALRESPGADLAAVLRRPGARPSQRKGRK
jgi:bifunctional non-homologous end joining protein LigD